jgi:tRNA-specific 2-thiouridylase
MAALKVAVALSGGVDSAVSAALLINQGFDVSSVTLRLLPESNSAGEQARLIAEHLGIPHTLLDLSTEFESTVIEPFCRTYSSGLTPNPCVVCNRDIKFGALLDYARESGFEYLATGHYARLDSAGEKVRLRKGIDSTKDQSYFLYALGQHQISSVLLPLGGYLKRDVYRIAREAGLDRAVQPQESQDICFVPGGDYAALTARYAVASAGDIVGTRGQILGRHEGIFRYTLGQRQGLGISSTRRLYVLKIDAVQNRIVVGEREELYTSEISAHRLTWMAGEIPSSLQGIGVRVRSQAAEVPAEVGICGDTARIRLASPQWAVTPGQSVVFYRGDEVLGGGIIAGTQPEERS